MDEDQKRSCEGAKAHLGKVQTCYLMDEGLSYRENITLEGRIRAISDTTLARIHNDRLHRSKSKKIVRTTDQIFGLITLKWSERLINDPPQFTLPLPVYVSQP